MIARLRPAVVALLLSASLPAAGLDDLHAPSTPHGEPSDLGLLDLFSNGWSEDWVHRHRATRDMALLRVTTNFLERELRLDYAYTELRAPQRFSSTSFGNLLMAYAVNRRLMLEVITNYQWNTVPRATPVHGAGGAALVRLQLVDTATASYSVQARVSAPNRAIGANQTTLGYFLAGWHDLHAWLPALDRVGLYWSVELDDLRGPHAKGASERSVSYDVSLAKTWTDARTPVVGDLTTFAEAYFTTPLDGDAGGKTTLSLTPGVRFWLLPKHSLTLGADVPLNNGRRQEWVGRATYILNF